MAKKQKYYVVWKGVTPGIYTSWNECQLQIKGFPGAVYKSFDNLETAKTAFDTGAIHPSGRTTKRKSEPIGMFSRDIIQDSISVDAACSGNPGLMEYRGVYTSDKSEIFRQGPFQHGTNNIGEFLAIVHALAFFKKRDVKKLIIYSDSATAIKWVARKKANTKLKQTNQNKILFDLIYRAELWLKNNQHPFTILKWDTKKWGEIPADFGRK